MEPESDKDKAISRRGWSAAQLTSWICRPSVLAATLVLAINDHVLKGAPGAPGWLTGKLSDVAGLFVFPIFVTAVAGALSAGHRRLTEKKVRQIGIGAAIGTTVAFCGLNLSPAVADALTGVWGHHTADPSDLWCLPSVLFARQWMSHRLETGPNRAAGAYLRVGALAVCGVACVATPAVPERYRTRPTWLVAHSPAVVSLPDNLSIRIDGANVTHHWEANQCGGTASVTLEVKNERDAARRVVFERALFEWATAPIHHDMSQRRNQAETRSGFWLGPVSGAAVVAPNEKRRLTTMMPPAPEPGLPLGDRWQEGRRAFAAVVFRTESTEKGPAASSRAPARRRIVCGSLGGTDPSGMTSLRRGCLYRRGLLFAAWPVASGKSGLGLLVRMWNLGETTSRVEFGPIAVDLVDGWHSPKGPTPSGEGPSMPEGEKLVATPNPSHRTISPAASNEVYVAFEYDNESAWNRGQRGAQLTVPLGIDGAEVLYWQVPLVHERATAGTGMTPGPPYSKSEWRPAGAGTDGEFDDEGRERGPWGVW